MTRVLLMGYPRVPQSGEGLLVAVGGEVNAELNKLGGPNSPSFLISPLPRGGFSGGPVISEHGFLLGVMSEALVRAAEPTELGFGSALSVEPIWGMLMDNDIYRPRMGCSSDTSREMRRQPASSWGKPREPRRVPFLTRTTRTVG
jgi:hypothetical protein